jgi:hypothetical protein
MPKEIGWMQKCQPFCSDRSSPSGYSALLWRWTGHLRLWRFFDCPLWVEEACTNLFHQSEPKPPSV